MVRKFSLAIVLFTMAGVASAGGSNKCDSFWFDSCGRGGHEPVRAPEIDPASAMSGLTMLAGGLAVLRGRRRKKLEE